jgi:hypothetical protein
VTHPDYPTLSPAAIAFGEYLKTLGKGDRWAMKQAKALVEAERQQEAKA